jgi:hypothetical protein
MADDPSQWTPRVDGVDPESLGDREQKAFDGPLSNHLIYARVPEILHGAQGMWRGLGSARRLESTLPPLLNRRVAILNGCVF